MPNNIEILLSSFELNNREIAILCWIGMVCFALAIKSEIRKAVFTVIQVMFARAIMLSLVAAGVYITLVIIILYKLGIWNWDNFKTSLVWAFTFALVTMFDIRRITEDDTFYRQSVKDTLNATTIVIFVAEFYTCSLFVELLIVPIATFITVLHAYGENKPEHQLTTNVLGWVLGGIGIAVLYCGFTQLYDDYENFATVTTLREFSVPILLSLFFLPFIYMLSVYLAYEQSFMRLHISIPDQRLRRYAKRRTLVSFWGKLELLKRWSRNTMHKRPQNKGEIDEGIHEVKRLAQVEKSPPPVPKEEGWSPYLAKDFLKDRGLHTKDYYNLQDLWSADGYMDVEDTGVLPNNVYYFVEGTEQAAHRLKLTLNVNNPDNTDTAELPFYELIAQLITVAINPSAFTKVVESMEEEEEDVFDIEIEGRRLRLSYNRWGGGGVSDGYSRSFTIDFNKDYRSPYD